jgi:hypothetical protein
MSTGNINAALLIGGHRVRAAATAQLAPAPAVDPAAVAARGAWRPELGAPQGINRPGGRPNNQPPPPANHGLTAAQRAHNDAAARAAGMDSVREFEELFAPDDDPDGPPFSNSFAIANTNTF